MNKLPLWNRYSTWQEAERAWDEGATSARKEKPIRQLGAMPSMPGITEETAKHLKWKSLYWMIVKDKGWRVIGYTLKRPFTHAYRYLSSIFSKKSYIRDGDFFYYGIRSEEEFRERLQDKDAVLVVGFSYCEKPFECPSGRFSDQCIHDPENSVCRQCFIGKALNTLPDVRTVPVIIPTIHYIGTRIFEAIEQHPGKKVYFLITACEMTLNMFSDYGNMAGVQGIGVRLDGRICNTMRAFELSEEGIKPGLTCTLPDTKRRMLNVLSFWRNISQNQEEQTKAPR